MCNEYKEGYYQSSHQCPKCKKHCVESSTPYNNEPHIIWYDCELCGFQWDGEEPYDSHCDWDYVGEAKELNEKIKEFENELRRIKND